MYPKQALITGAASGLGLELCKLLAADSHNLLMVDKDGKGLELAARSIAEKHGIETKIFIKDLGINGAAEELYAELAHLEFDILINSAGFGLFGFFSETDWAMEEAMLQVIPDGSSEYMMKPMRHSLTMHVVPGVRFNEVNGYPNSTSEPLIGLADEINFASIK